MYFPKEIWYIIKNYEFQILFPPNIQRKYKNNLKSIVRLPFLLKIECQKNFIYQYSYIKKEYSFYWQIFSDEYIQKVINQELNNMYENYELIYLTNICSGR